MWRGKVGWYLALALSAISVNGGTGELEIVQVIVQAVAGTFGFDKDQGTCGGLFEEEIHQTLFLVKFFNVEDLFSAYDDEVRRGRDSTLWVMLSVVLPTRPTLTKT